MRSFSQSAAVQSILYPGEWVWFNQISFLLLVISSAVLPKQMEWVMICGRVIAGIGGGGLTAISTFLASDLIPLRRRGLWQGFGNVVYGTKAGLGALSGGWINDVWNWRVAFVILVPLTIVSGSLVFFTIIKEPAKKTENGATERIDFLGAFMLVLSLTLLLLGVNLGGNTVPWTHPLVLTTILLSVVFLGVFIYMEKTCAIEPIIPVQLTLDCTVCSACMTNWCDSTCFFLILFYGPIYFQVCGLSTTQADVRLIPQSIGGGFGSIVSGLVMRLRGRYYLLSLGIQSIFVVDLIIALTFTLSTSIGRLRCHSFCAAWAMPACWPPPSLPSSTLSSLDIKF